MSPWLRRSVAFAGVGILASDRDDTAIVLLSTPGQPGGGRGIVQREYWSTGGTEVGLRTVQQIAGEKEDAACLHRDWTSIRIIKAARLRIKIDLGIIVIVAIVDNTRLVSLRNDP